MRLLILASTLFFSLTSFALSMVRDYDTSLISALPGICPQPVNCTPGTNFLSRSKAEQCGACRCHGGVYGCAGGAKGRITCGDGTYDLNYGCQYHMKP